MIILQKMRLKLRNRLRFKGHNNTLTLNSNRIRYCDISLRGNNNQLVFAEGTNLKGVTIEIEGNNCLVRIGKHCVIGEQTYLSCRGQETQLTIGDDCMFSRNVKVMTSDGHNIYQHGERINANASIHIGHHVWLADNCVILKGNNVHDNAIVGINAVVTKAVDANTIVAGNPAKVIKSNTSWGEELSE